MTDDELLRLFEAGAPPPDGFHHEQHVRVAWIYLERLPLAEALGRFTATLRRFAEQQGQPELYHETITVAFVLLINERLVESRGASWQEFARRHADLLAWKPSILDRYYSDAILWSDAARHTFVMPDRLARP
ncbi:MAG: hypothetical protein ACRD2N_05380 [Vicinamibacterales bacterium]